MTKAERLILAKKLQEVVDYYKLPPWYDRFVKAFNLDNKSNLDNKRCIKSK
jgi:hypothetical protein